MTETSRSRVTVTLGRSGQVVKRAASDIDFSDSSSSRGDRKRSVGHRLGSNLGSSFSNGSEAKRQRGDAVFSGNGMDGNAGISKDDLRFKLMRKNAFKRAQSDDQKVTDLREKLIRMGQPFPTSSGVERHQRKFEPRSNIIMGQIPSTRIAYGLSRSNSLRSSYPSWTSDHLKRRSPETIVAPSRGLSPSRNIDRLQGRQLSRPFDDTRVVPYTSKGVLEASRPISSSLFTTRSTLPPPTSQPPPYHIIRNTPPPPATLKPPAPSAPGPPLLSRLPPPGHVAQEAPPVVEEHQTLDSLLNSLGLGKYAILFKVEEVDMTALKQMGENDLKELGIPMGPRKKILLALLPRGKRQPGDRKTRKVYYTWEESTHV